MKTHENIKIILILLLFFWLVNIVSATDYIDYYHEGKKLYDQQKYQEAIDSFQKCLKYNDRFSSAIFYIMLSCLNVQPQQASCARGAAYQMNYLRDNARTWTDKGELYLKMGLYDDAIDAYQNAIEWDSSSTYPMKQLASIYAKFGYYDDAIQWYDRILEINPSDDWKIKNQRDDLIVKRSQTTPTITPTRLITTTPTIPIPTLTPQSLVNTQTLKTPGYNFEIAFIGIILAFIVKLKKS